jgi:hypothetical protein
MVVALERVATMRYLHDCYYANFGRLNTGLERCFATCRSVCEDERLELVDVSVY